MQVRRRRDPLAHLLSRCYSDMPSMAPRVMLQQQRPRVTGSSCSHSSILPPNSITPVKIIRGKTRWLSAASHGWHGAKRCRMELRALCEDSWSLYTTGLQTWHVHIEIRATRRTDLFGRESDSFGGKHSRRQSKPMVTHSPTHIQRVNFSQKLHP